MERKFFLEFCVTTMARLSSALCGRVFTPGMTQTGLWWRVYYFTTATALLRGSDGGSDDAEPALVKT